ncbi:hypothetical protein LOTGIDRAFT_108969, partial [Lottia gigantea]
QSQSLDPNKLLELTRSSSEATRYLGVEALAGIECWKDYQFKAVGEKVDGRTLVGLARSKDVDLRYFSSPPCHKTSQKAIYEELIDLLLLLPDTHEDKCIEYFTQIALKHAQPLQDQGGFWSFGGSTLASPDSKDHLSESTIELSSLAALVRHSTIHSNCVKIVDSGGLALLQRVYQMKCDCLKTKILIGRILANLSIIKQLHDSIITSGWISILAEWINCNSLVLTSLAAKILSNLDSDFIHHTLEEGVYILHPIHRTKKKPILDIVLIHGIMGGSFKTWRQNDSSKLQNDNTSSCWPKDWLTEDIIGDIRIISVDYDTHLSEWAADCPYDTQKRSLANRGDEMIMKLKQAGIGERPIIWLGHSLGGLLIKQILELSVHDTTRVYGGIKDSTKGFIFYGVPHHGSYLSKLSNKAFYILYPSVEVQDLDHESPKLKLLQNNFLQYVQNNSIPCLTFGELRKTQVTTGLKLDIVPPASSDTGYGDYHQIDTDHIGICKPSDKSSEIYQKTLDFIVQYLESNEDIVSDLYTETLPNYLLIEAF